jgi:hypothetical protein
MEYMNSEVAFPVGYRFIPVNDGEYLEGQNQFWADPDIGHAARILVRLLDDPVFARATGERARDHMRMNYSDIAIGKRYRARLEAIVSGNRAFAAFDPATPPRP